ncbi:hypothetical protein HPB52_017993 [Rhipicephalus sanguineus]|uniref:Uncharacterized protein n=1 Tax=Rhipicephalus sanguineus TaxID=34632 RepID=A0A9D4PP03_RHISA|nr:hypothetical protein HPB52_017993 [Rhipicephalus sanguineus]
MPRLPEDDYKVVLRPNGAINLTDVGPAIIVEAICIAAGIDFRLALKEDQTRILTSTWTTEGDEPDACTCSAATSCICDSRSTTQWQMAKRSPRPTNSTSASFGTTLLFTSKTCMTM